jgi:hypothetical protein
MWHALDRSVLSFDWEIGKTRNRLENLGLEGRNMLKWSLKKEWEGMDWINLTPGRDLWWASVHMIMIVRFI